MVRILGQSHSLLNQFMAEIRDADIQQDSLRFRYNLERIGEIFAYEISKELAYEQEEVVTSLGIANVPVLTHYPVLATILRAGLPFHQGFLKFFDRSANAFISAYRMAHKDGSFSMSIEYASSTPIDGKVLIICDTMMASGSSMVYTYKELLTRGKPAHVHLATILASMEGLNQLKKSLPKKNVTIWVGDVDDELTAQLFLVPGLGDAGDLAYGEKD
ncbi:MAG: uracil phosphoribosyltransferase [Bacteroidetes bacterium]|nr:MAG: uracil phosphoribosyltransferase [Bacteroidota bacterium]